jgi:small-conductance mechanosensitive channel
MLNILGQQIALPAALSFLAAPLVVLLVNLAAWALLALVVYLVLRFLLRRVAYATETQIDDLALTIIRRPLVTMMLIYGVLNALQIAFGAFPLLTLLLRLYRGAAIVVGAYVGWQLLYKVVIAYLKPKVQRSDSQADDILIPVLSRIGPVIIVVAAANAIVSVFGGNLAALLAGLGLVSLLVTYLFQEPLQGIFSGTYMALDNPFREDDLILLEDGAICQVRQIGLRLTQLYDVKHHTLSFITNNRLASNKIINLNKPGVELRTDTKVVMNRSYDPTTAIALLMEACNSHENVLGAWAQKEQPIRRRQAAYREELQRLEATQEPSLEPASMLAQERRVGELRSQIDRLDRELIRLQVEDTLRRSGEQFSQDLLSVALWVTQLQSGGLTGQERQEIKERAQGLMDEFDGLVEQMTVWLYLIKTIQYELGDGDGRRAQEGIVASIMQGGLLQDQRLTLQELRDSALPLAPTRPMVLRDDLERIRSSEIETDKVVDRAQFCSRADYIDYRRLYCIWHRNITRTYRGLDQIYHLEQVKDERELHLGRRVHELERQFSDSFLLQVARWQLPNANLVEATDQALRFELTVFVDDVLREHFHRADRVTTEVLVEIERLKQVRAVSGER